MKILIADDNAFDRRLLEVILCKDGHTVFQAADGQDALDVFRREQPDLVMMDILMPTLDGYEVVKRIKANSGNRFTPVIFLTAFTDDEMLARCVEVGGDDFLTKPYSKTILRAKVAALDRIRRLHDVVREQNIQLSAYDEHLHQEEAFSQSIFENTLRFENLNRPDVAYHRRAARKLSGDILLCATVPIGTLRVMVGDFTGHGLSAAIGTLRVADIFFGMTSHGFSLSDVLAEINHKLKTILPSNLFCAASVIELDHIEHRLTIWNGGLPDLLLHRKQAGLVERFPSRHLPLGVGGQDVFDSSMDVITVDEGDRLFLYTDGVVEACDPEGAMFGRERLERYLSSTQSSTQLIEEIVRGLDVFCARAKQRDDIAMIALTSDPNEALRDASDTISRRKPESLKKWRVGLELGAEALRRVDPLPQFMMMLTKVQELRPHRHQLFTILTELVTNTIDHGLLGLDSRLKAAPGGFEKYYAVREAALAALQEGTIRVRMDHEPIMGTGERVIIRVEDSGAGFDHSLVLSDLENNTSCHGRGLFLVRSLCREIVYHGNGNSVEAVYVW